MTLYQKALQFCQNLQLPRNVSKRTDCPCCHGVNTFSVSTVDGRLAFMCYRASCAIKGRQNLTMSMKDIKEKNIERPPEPLKLKDCVGWVDKLDDYPHVIEYLIKNNCIDAYRNNPTKFFYDRITDRVVFVEHGGINSFKIATGRSLCGTAPKWYKYRPMLPYSYFKMPKIDPYDFEYATVIVEDCASACSVARVANGLALCGTSWNLENLLKTIGSTKDIIVSLDKDARLKNIKLRLDLLGAGNFRSVKIIQPEDDCKYLDKNTLYKLVYGHTVNDKENMEAAAHK